MSSICVISFKARKVLKPYPGLSIEGTLGAFPKGSTLDDARQPTLGLSLPGTSRHDWLSSIHSLAQHFFEVSSLIFKIQAPFGFCS